ncbi:MAG: hypothetical protein V4649_18820 [Bacteroidota bacterium]
MTKGEELFHEIAAGIPDAKESKMFGALCIKAPNGKAGVMYWKGYIVFKLEGKHQEAALRLKDAKVFAPMDGRPMNGWVQVSEEHSPKWKEYATLAMDYVKTIEVKKKKK